MDPNAQNPQGDSSAVNKLEQDLQNLKQETPATPQELVPVVEPLQPLPQVPEETPAPPVPSVPSSSPVEANTTVQDAPKKGSPLMIVAIILAVVAVLAVVAYVFGAKLLSSQPTLTPTPVAVVVPTQTPDPTANWKTYTSQVLGLSFKYPQGYKVEERSPGFIVVSLSTETAPQGGISIDARQQGSYQTFAKAQENISSSFIATQSSQINGWTTYTGIGKTGMIKDIKFKLAIAPYKAGAIEMETIDNQPYSGVFGQILSTFKFIEATPSSSPTASPIASPTSSPSATVTP